jgi:hypothetical protein
MSRVNTSGESWLGRSSPMATWDGDGQAYALINGAETKHSLAEEEW